VTAVLDAARRLVNPTLRAEHAVLRDEQRIANELGELPPGWFVVPALEIEVLDGAGGPADYCVIGPGGVFIIRLHHLPDGRVWVSERTMTINGQTSNHSDAARFEARRAGGRLTEACGFAVTVQSVLVMIGATVQTVSRPAEVHVRNQHDLRDWLCMQPRRVDAEAGVAIHRTVSGSRPSAGYERGSSTTTGICRDVLR
jgi:hypothetical protein